MLPDVMLDLAQLFIVLEQDLSVSVVAPYLGSGTMIMELHHSIINFWSEVVAFLKKLKLAGHVSAEGASRREWCSLEGLYVLMRVPSIIP